MGSEIFHRHHTSSRLNKLDNGLGDPSRIEPLGSVFGYGLEGIGEMRKLDDMGSQGSFAIQEHVMGVRRSSLDEVLASLPGVCVELGGRDSFFCQPDSRSQDLGQAELAASELFDGLDPAAGGSRNRHAVEIGERNRATVNALRTEVFEAEGRRSSSRSVDGPDFFGLCVPEEAEQIAPDAGTAWFSHIQSGSCFSCGNVSNNVRTIPSICGTYQ